jgi:hypothetical protein
MTTTLVFYVHPPSSMLKDALETLLLSLNTRSLITLKQTERNVFEFRLRDPGPNETTVAKVVLNETSNHGLGEFRLYLRPNLETPIYTNTRFVGDFEQKVRSTLEEVLKQTQQSTALLTSDNLRHEP